MRTQPSPATFPIVLACILMDIVSASELAVDANNVGSYHSCIHAYTFLHSRSAILSTDGSAGRDIGGHDAAHLPTIGQ